MSDKGQIYLIADLGEIFEDILDFKYHDLKSSFPAPKEALIQKLEWVVKNTRNGKYKNEREVKK